jgi:hypothetical protein
MLMLLPVESVDGISLNKAAFLLNICAGSNNILTKKDLHRALLLRIRAGFFSINSQAAETGIPERPKSMISGLLVKAVPMFG